MNCFGHSGDLGDIIWALPTIKATGGGVLFLSNRPGRTTFSMTQDRVNSIRSLLLLQPYIKEVILTGDNTSRDSAINGFRDHCCNGRNLADAHLATHGLPFFHRNGVWLCVDVVDIIKPVVFARSARYHNDKFPWQRILEVYGKHAVFLGTQDEYSAFTSEFGYVPFRQTGDLLQAARIIAGAQLFVGNQSCLHAIAEGLKRNIILEVCTSMPNCIFNRMGVVHAWDENFEFPVLSLNSVEEFDSFSITKGTVDAVSDNSVAELEEVTTIPGINDAVCINLQRRPERWTLFKLRAAEAGLGFIRRFNAIDGNELNVPRQLKSHNGAYGCLHSHASVYKEALKKGHSNLLVVEDDCEFSCDKSELIKYLAATIGRFSWIHLAGC